MLAKTDYHTVWLSNQEPFSFFRQVSPIFESRCCEKNYSFTKADTISGAVVYDEALLPLLDDTLKNTARINKTFITLHLAGAHLAYINHYPPSFNKFTTDQEPGTTPKQRQTQAEYDNALCIMTSLCMM